MHPLEPSGQVMNPQPLAILATARLLQRSAQQGRPLPKLTGRHLGLLCSSGHEAWALPFVQAMKGLDVRVSRVPSMLHRHSDAGEIRKLACMLSQLYHAVECLGLHPAVVRQIAAASDVPVFRGLASPHHPIALLWGQLDAHGTPDQKWQWLVQATMLETLS